MEASTQPSTQNPFDTEAETFEETHASSTNIKASIGEYIDATLEFSTNIAISEVREEGSRCRSVLEQLSLTIQTTAEETARVRIRPLESMLESILDRLVALERRMDQLTTQSNPPDPVLEVVPAEAATATHINSKGILQDRCVMHGIIAPAYTQVRQTGPSDSPVFLFACTIPEKSQTCTGVGLTKRSAQQSAALTMLHKLAWPVSFPTDEEREVIRERREKRGMVE